MYELRWDKRCSHLFWRNDKLLLSWKDEAVSRVGSEAARSFSRVFLKFILFYFFSPTCFICHSVLLPTLLSLMVLPRTSSLCPNLASAAFTCCADVARCWRDGAPGKNSTAGSDDSGKCSHLQRQVLKVITKGWRHRAHPDPAAQPRPLRRRRRRSAGVWDEPSSCVLPQREGCPLSLITVRAS